MGGILMALSGLRCSRDGERLFVTWSWDVGEEPARITISRLLDGETLISKEIGRYAFRTAISGPERALVFQVPPVPLRIEVRDGDGAQSVEQIDKPYRIEWRLVKRKILQRKGLFGGERLVRTDVALQLRFPCNDQVPSDLIYYVLAPPGRKPGQNDPIGFLPTLHPGMNTYGQIPVGGRDIELRCNPQHEAFFRLFSFKRLPDLEQ